MKPVVKPWIRWTGWFVVATTFAVGCVALASWQIERRAEAVAKIQRVAANYDQAPISAEGVLGLNESEVVPLEWRQVELSGSYLAEDALLVRNRAVAGQPDARTRLARAIAGLAEGRRTARGPVPLPRRPRRAHRPAQPGSLSAAAAGDAGEPAAASARRAGAERDDARPRPLQTGQRPTWPCGGRPPAAHRGRAAAPCRADRRCGGSAGRR